MRISDWSSDVCSSDLRPDRIRARIVDLAVGRLSDLPDRARRARAGDGRAAPRPAGGCGGDDAVARGARCLCGATTVPRTAAHADRTADRITGTGVAPIVVSPN